MSAAPALAPPELDALGAADEDELSLPSVDDRYERLEAIGKGVYGTVIKARDTETGRIVAMKLLKLQVEGVDDDLDPGVPSHVLREASLLRDLRHPNVVELLAVQVSQDMSECALVIEYIEQDLHQLLKGHRREGTKLPVDDVLQYSRQLLSGLHACHQRLILHRDLKPQNILVHPGGDLKICDFGLARCFTVPLERYTREVITIWYRAPEILLGQAHYGPEVDVWSAGCIVAEMAMKQPYFVADSEIMMIFKIFQALGTPTQDTWPGHSELHFWNSQFPKWPPGNLDNLAKERPELGDHGLDLIRGLLTVFPPGRLSARRAKNHPWFQVPEVAAGQP